MKQYQELKNGYLSTPTSSFGNHVSNKDYRKLLKEVAANEAVILPYVKPAPDPKEVRNAALNSLTYDFGDGRVIQVRPKDGPFVSEAIEVMTNESIPSIDWVMLDNKKYPVSIADLTEARKQGRLLNLAVWNDYNP